MAQTNSWIKQSYSMSVHDLITKQREYEIEQETNGSGSYERRLAAFIAERDRRDAEDDIKRAKRRAKLKAAMLRKQGVTSLEPIS